MKSADNKQSAKSKKASHIVYYVRDESFWIHIGSAWTHADGKGFNIQVDLIPRDGRLTLRVNEPK